MIQLPLVLVHQFLSLLRLAGLRYSDANHLTLQADDQGLTLQAGNREITIQCRQQGSFQACSLALQVRGLAGCRGPKDEPLLIESQGHTNILTWKDAGVPQHRSHPAATPDEILPLPSAAIDNSTELLEALARAAEVTDRGSARYALDCIRIGGTTGQIVSTDGRQLFAQSGFSFGRAGQVLLPGSRVFGSSILQAADRVCVGHTDDQVVFQASPWAAWLRKNTEGRFPCIEDYLTAPRAQSTLVWTAEDAEFVKRTISRLPATEPNSAVTLDLNGHVAVRAQAEDHDAPTELVLCGSRYDGTPVRTSMDRQFLARAARFHCDRVLLQGPEQLIYAAGPNRCYAWMPLDPAAAVRSSERAIQIASSSRGTSARSTRRLIDSATARRTAVEVSDISNPHEQLQHLQKALQSALDGVGRLMSTMQGRTGQSARATT